MSVLVHATGKVLHFPSREEAERFLELTKENERDEWILEEESSAVARRETRPMVYLTRKIEFSASHLYHNPQLSAEENKRIFGKCNNPHGHGHNYALEVTVAGEPDPVTGMVLDLKELKEILEREITQKMDHRFLNYEVPELKGQIPTCENIVRVIWNLL
jgi:6-pyruvoyltetrahydropterin/6-carboxytetrahydropterin synthase